MKISFLPRAWASDGYSRVVGNHVGVFVPVASRAEICSALGVLVREGSPLTGLVFAGHGGPGALYLGAIDAPTLDASPECDAFWRFDVAPRLSTAAPCAVHLLGCGVAGDDGELDVGGLLLLGACLRLASPWRRTLGRPSTPARAVHVAGVAGVISALDIDVEAGVDAGKLVAVDADRWGAGGGPLALPLPPARGPRVCLDLLGGARLDDAAGRRAALADYLGYPLVPCEVEAPGEADLELVMVQRRRRRPDGVAEPGCLVRVRLFAAAAAGGAMVVRLEAQIGVSGALQVEWLRSEVAPPSPLLAPPAARALDRAAAAPYNGER